MNSGITYLKTKTLLILFSGLLLFSTIGSAKSINGSNSPIVDASDAQKVGMIELIKGKKTVSATRGGASMELTRGATIQLGDTIETSTETVLLQLNKFNEVQLAPHSKITFSEVKEGGDSLHMITLEQGIIWGLIANAVSMAYPYYVKTSNGIAAVSGANFIAEYVPASEKTSFVSLEGNMKYSKKYEDFKDPTKVVYLISGLRVHINKDQISKAQKVKRSVIIGYLNHKAKLTAEDMALRGQKVLTIITKKYEPPVGDDDITWNNIVGVAANSTGGPGFQSSMGSSMPGPGMRSMGSMPSNGSGIPAPSGM